MRLSPGRAILYGTIAVGSTIQLGLRELAAGEPLVGGRTRKTGRGRKRAIDLDATLPRDFGRVAFRCPSQIGHSIRFLPLPCEA